MAELTFQKEYDEVMLFYYRNREIVEADRRLSELYSDLKTHMDTYYDTSKRGYDRNVGARNAKKCIDEILKNRRKSNESRS